MDAVLVALVGILSSLFVFFVLVVYFKHSTGHSKSHAVVGVAYSYF